MKLTVNDILRSGADVRLPVGSPDTVFEGAYVDSREPVEGALFVGLRGELADGGQHAPDALRDGAAAALVGESAWRWIEGDAQGMRRTGETHRRSAGSRGVFARRAWQGPSRGV